MATPTLADLLAKNSDLFAAYEKWSNGQTALLSGTPDDPASFNADGGKTGTLGYYPVVNVNGQTIYVPCMARLQAIALGTSNPAEIDRIVQASATALSAAGVAQGLSRFAATRAEGVARYPVDEYFASAETGSLRIYHRINIAPGYQDAGDSAAPIAKSDLQPAMRGRLAYFPVLPIPVAFGGTGSSTATGFGAVVRQASPTISGHVYMPGRLTLYGNLRIIFGSISSAGSVRANFVINQANAYFGWNGRTLMWSPADGAITLASSTSGNKTALCADMHTTLGAAPVIASAATIAPLVGIVFVSGNVAINTITPPPHMLTRGGQITLIPTGAWTLATGGNIALASNAVVNRALIVTYDPTTARWYPSY